MSRGHVFSRGLLVVAIAISCEHVRTALTAQPDQHISHALQSDEQRLWRLFDAVGRTFVERDYADLHPPPKSHVRANTTTPISTTVQLSAVPEQDDRREKDLAQVREFWRLFHQEHPVVSLVGGAEEGGGSPSSSTSSSSKGTHKFLHRRLIVERLQLFPVLGYQLFGRGAALLPHEFATNDFEETLASHGDRFITLRGVHKFCDWFWYLGGGRPRRGRTINPLSRDVGAGPAHDHIHEGGSTSRAHAHDCGLRSLQKEKLSPHVLLSLLRHQHFKPKSNPAPRRSPAEILAGDKALTLLRDLVARSDVLKQTPPPPTCFSTWLYLGLREVTEPYAVCGSRASGQQSPEDARRIYVVTK